MVNNDPPGDLNAPVDAVLRLDPRLDAAGAARRFVDDNRDHLDADVIANAQLLVSEIVTNAVLHGAGEITLQLRLDPPGIGVSVTDTGEQMPVVPTVPPPSDRGSGRGLLVVDSVADRWGVTPIPWPRGKTVWFDVRPDGDERE